MKINKKYVVILDDNEITNFYNQDVLEDMVDFDEVGVFDNPHKLLEEISLKMKEGGEIPGCFLVDIKMPEMDGFEFLDQLEVLFKDQDEFPEIFMLTTSTHKRDRDRFEKCNLAKGYMVKPLVNEPLKKQLFYEREE